MARVLPNGSIDVTTRKEDEGKAEPAAERGRRPYKKGDTVSTRSLTVFEDERGNEVAVLYKHFDGYPEGWGHELAEFVSTKEILSPTEPGTAVVVPIGSIDMSHLPVQVIAQFAPKFEPDEFCLYPAGTRDCGAEYVYYVRFEDGHAVVEVGSK